MHTTYKNTYRNRYNIEYVGFFVSFLYLLGLRESPYKKPVDHIIQKSDFEKLKSDWDMVGQDFNTVLRKEKLEADAC